MLRNNTRVDYWLSGLLAMVIGVTSMQPSLLFAQSSDSEPPVISHEIVDTGERGEIQEFVAEITDNVGVTKAILHYRFSGTAEYTSVEMTRQSDTRFAAEVATSRDSGSPIEYYIEALDEAGLVSLQGFSFEPLQRWLDPEGERATDTIETPKKSNVLLYVLGGVAILALAGLAGGGGDDPTPTTDTLTFNVTAPGAN